MLTRSCPIQQTSELRYRCGQPAVTDDDLAGQLRTDKKFITNHQWNLAKAATGSVERYVKIGLVPQVRVLHQNRFPWRYERRRLGNRIRLDWRAAWSLERWQSFVAAAEAETAPDWLQDCHAALLDEGFVADQLPILITYGGCCSDDTSTLDHEEIKLKNTEQGDFLSHVDCCWPCLSCCCPGCDGVQIKYIVGYHDPCQILNLYPQLHHNILASFGWMHEQPELQNQQYTQEGWDRVLRPLLNQLRWTI